MKGYEVFRVDRHHAGMPSDERFADELEKRGILIVTIEDALVLAAVRKYISWLNNGPSEPIASLNYVKPVIAEIQQQPWPPDYREHLREKLIQYVELWQRDRQRDDPSGTRKRH